MVSGLQEQPNWLVWLTDTPTDFPQPPEEDEEDVPSFPPTFLFPLSVSLHVFSPLLSLHSYFLCSTLVASKLFRFSSSPALWLSSESGAERGGVICWPLQAHRAVKLEALVL